MQTQPTHNSGGFTPHQSNKPAPKPPTPAVVPPNTLNEHDIAALREEGFDDAAITAVAADLPNKCKSSSSGRTVASGATVVANQAKLMELAQGRKVLSANSICTGLVMHGKTDRPISANAWGDACGRGRKGLQLPSVKFSGVMHYDIGYIGRSAADCAQRTAQLRALSGPVLEMLIGEIKEPVVDTEAAEAAQPEADAGGFAPEAADGEPAAPAEGIEHEEGSYEQYDGDGGGEPEPAQDPEGGYYPEEQD